MKLRFFNFLCFTFICFSAKTQVVINEVFADPSPPVSLPEAEFVEILNISDEEINLESWALADASSQSSYFENVLLSPNEYLIICDADEEEFFTEFGNVLGLSSFPSLNNNGDEISLINETGLVVDFFSYDSSSYDDAIKGDGGWTLERINPKNDCDLSSNWTASVHENGGSPGEENSVYDPDFADDSQIGLLSVWLADEYTLEVTFSKRPQKENLENHVSISPNIAINNYTLTSTGSTLVINFSAPAANETQYKLSIQDLNDCANISTISDETIFGIPQAPRQGDIFLNEILFNPASGGVDFIEILNISDKLFALDALHILEIDPNTNIVDDYLSMDLKRYFQPQELLVFTENPAIIQEQYEVEFPKNLIEVNLPNYSDEEGVVAILNAQLDTLDQLHYFEDWHFEGLSDYNGVSLERISTEEPSQSSSNWFSASYNQGYATPTSENSQKISPEISSESQLKLSHEVFTPDLDGIDDMLTISFQENHRGNSATIAAYNIQGFLVKTIVNNQLIGSSNQFRWTGLDDEGQSLPLGHYIIVAEVYDENGNQTIYKKKVVLSRRQ